MSIVDLVITGGQSQMSGYGTGTLAPDTDPAKCWDWTGSAFVTVDDPNSSSGGYKAQTGSPIPSFVNTFTSASGRPIAMVRAAVGGTALLAANTSTNGHWDVNGTLFPASVNRATAAINALIAAGHTIGNVFVIWSQGYRDALGGQNLHLYEAAQGALVQRWRTALSRPDLRVYIERMYAPATATPTVAERCMQIRAAQISAEAATPGLHIAFTEGEEYAARGWLHTDNLHYNQTGLNYMGTQFAQYAIENLDITPVDPPPPTAIPSDVSHAARYLMVAPRIRPTEFVWASASTLTWEAPSEAQSIVIECEGPGAPGGAGGIGIKGSAGGGGAYAKKNSMSVTPGQTFSITVGGPGGAYSRVVRDSDSVVLCQAQGGTAGASGDPNGDGSGGLAANCVGDVKTSGQAGGISGIDNGGNGAAPLGGAGGVGPGPIAGTAPGGGGAGALAGTANLGGSGSTGLVKIVVTYSS